MRVTIHKGGTAEYTVPLAELHIPDLWHVVASCPEDRAKLIECWHIAHALKTELIACQTILESTLNRVAEAMQTVNLPPDADGLFCGILDDGNAVLDKETP